MAKIFTCFLVVLASTISLSRAQVLNVAVGEFHPLAINNIENNGVVLELVKSAFKAEGYEVAYTFMPWARVDFFSKQGGFDAVCCWFYQEERASKALYSDVVFSYSIHFYHLKSLDFDWKKINDLKGYKIGATRSYTYTREFSEAEKNGTLDVTRQESDLQNFKMLATSRIDIFPVNSLEASYFLEKLSREFNTKRIVHHPKPLVDDEDLSVLFPATQKASEQLIEAFNRGLSSIKKSGEYDRIVQQFLTEHTNVEH
ncbi:MAG: transporter substrate-binding domain-containing protein [Reinekea sp.]|nr:transporter substrate-binding domain-containing protein [Reinekea sp.]MDX1473625.1 transporter substrate-binding domain-containing protein [Reinekea sp.]